MKKSVPMPALTRVAPNNTAILECPLGATYHNLTFSLTGTALAVTHITGVRVMVDGNEVQTFKSLQALFDLNAFYGRSVDTVNEFMIHFKRDEFDSLSDKRTPAFGTADIQTFTVELDLAAGAPANITIAAQAYIDTVREPLLVFNRIKTFQYASSVAGDVEFEKLIKGATYNAIHMFKADVNKVQLEVDGVKYLDSTKALLERQQKQARPTARVPQTAKATHIDFLLQGDVGDLFDTAGVTDLRLRMTLGSLGSVDIITEQFDKYVPLSKALVA